MKLFAVLHKYKKGEQENVLKPFTSNWLHILDILSVNKKKVKECFIGSKSQILSTTNKDTFFILSLLFSYPFYLTP